MSEIQEQPTPIFFYQGQPTSPESAAATRAALMADPEFTKAALVDGAKQKQLADLWMIERGMVPAVPLPSTPSAADVRAVESQAEARVAREQAVQAENLRSAGLTAKAIYEVLGGRPMPADEKAFWERELDAIMRSKELKQKILDGDPEVTRKFRTASIGARALRVGTLEEIQAWDAAHPFKAA